MANEDEIRSRLRALTDSVVELPAGEMALPYSLAIAQADKFVALTSVLPASFMMRALVGPLPEGEPERERMQRRRESVRALILGGERKAAEQFMFEHAAPQAPALKAVAAVAEQAWASANLAEQRAALDAAIAKGQLNDELDSDTLALLVMFQLGDAIEGPLRTLLDQPSPPEAELQTVLERRAELLSMLSAAFLARPIAGVAQ